MKQFFAEWIPENCSVFWDYDDSPIDGSFDFEDEKQNQEYLDRFRRGELANIFIKVSYWDKSRNISGDDCLGACHIASIQDIQSVIDDHGMIDNAKAEMLRKVAEVKDRNK